MSFRIAPDTVQHRDCENDRGASLLEYMLLASILVAAILVGVVSLGGEASKNFDNPELKGALTGN